MISIGVTNLVTGSVTETGEQRSELAADCGIGVLSEDNLLETGSAGNLSRAQSATGYMYNVDNPNLTRVWLLINRLAVVSTYGVCQCRVAMGLMSEKVWSYGVEDHQLSNTGRAYKSHVSNWVRVLEQLIQTYLNRGDEQWQTLS
jgi:hypothetical protein